MIEIEVRGIPCVFNDEALNDFEMLETLAKMQEGDIVAIVAFAKGIFGEEQLDNVKSQLRGDDGKVSLVDMNGFINESIMEAARAKKADAKN